MNPFLAAGGVVAVSAAVRGLWSPCGLSMISTITPMSERTRGHRFGVTATWFTLGGVAGGATLGAAMALGAWLWHLTGFGTSVGVAVFAVATVVTVVSDVPSVGFTLPIHPRQVNETWLRRLRAWAYASGFGWQIGTGFATYIMTAGVYLTVAAGVLSATPLGAFSLGVVFGLVRGACVFVATRATDPVRLQRLHATIERLAAPSLGVAMAAQIAGLALLGALTGAPVVLGIAVVLAAATAAASLHRNRATHGAPVTPAP